MKEIKAYIQHKIHVRGMSVNDMKGFGKEEDESYPHHSKDLGLTRLNINRP